MQIASIARSSALLSALMHSAGLIGEGGMVRPVSFVTASFFTLLVALVVVDLGFVLADVLLSLAEYATIIPAAPELFKVTVDGALPEDFNYLKWAVIVVALLWIALRDRWMAPLIWAGIFTMVLFDDSFQLHERLGHKISAFTGLPAAAWLIGDDFGEIAVFLTMAFFAAIAVTPLMLRGGRDRRISKRYLVVLFLLGVFGVGVDAVHQMISHLIEYSNLDSVMPYVLGLVEDGGEMLVASLALAMTLASDPLPGNAKDGSAQSEA